jgi:hypothetical protein
VEKTGFHEDFINGAGKTVTAEIFFLHGIRAFRQADFVLAEML